MTVDTANLSPSRMSSLGLFLKTVGRNSGALTISGAAQKLATFLVLVLANRALSKDQFGAYALVLATAEIVRVVSAFGVDQITLRALARAGERHDHILSNALLLKALATVGAIVIFAGAAWYLRFTPAMWVGWGVLSIDYFLSAGVLSLVSYHQASVRADRAVPAVLLGTGATLAVGVLAFALHAPMPWFLASMPAGNAVALVTLWLMSRRWVRPSFGLASRAALISFASAAWPLAVTGAVVLLYFRVSTLMLAKLDGLGAVASYTPAYKLSEAFLLLPAALAGTTLPVLAASLRHGPSRASVRAYQSALLVSLALSVPFGIGTSLLGRFVLIHLFGPSYAGSALALTILGWATVLMSLNIQTTNALIALDRERLVMAITVVNLATNIVANLILIPRLSFNGSAYATLLTEGVNFAMQAGLVAYFLRPSRWHISEAATT
jgi:O-antigen/teichoic acid export membrane protein